MIKRINLKDDSNSASLSLSRPITHSDEAYNRFSLDGIQIAIKVLFVLFICTINVPFGLNAAL